VFIDKFCLALAYHTSVLFFFPLLTPTANSSSYHHDRVNGIQSIAKPQKPCPCSRYPVDNQSVWYALLLCEWVQREHRFSCWLKIPSSPLAATPSVCLSGA
jgi:hypothetical protein